MHTCKNCDKIIKTKERERPRDTHRRKFCDRSCAATYNNKKYPKRVKKEYYCKVCGAVVKYRRKYCSSRECRPFGPGIKKKTYCKECNAEVPYRRSYCNNCMPQKYKHTISKRVIDWSEITIAEIRAFNLKRPYTRITGHSRRVYLTSDKPNQCVKCGYDRHFNVCHIKPIHMFDDNTPVSIVNNLNNLIALCPTHHWELDNGFLNVKELLN